MKMLLERKVRTHPPIRRARLPLPQLALAICNTEESTAGPSIFRSVMRAVTQRRTLKVSILDMKDEHCGSISKKSHIRVQTLG